MTTNFTMTELEKLTFVVEHNPKGPDPYLVRLIAPGEAFLDKAPPGSTGDILGYGNSLEEAGASALRKLEMAKTKSSLVIVPVRDPVKRGSFDGSGPWLDYWCVMWPTGRLFLFMNFSIC